MVFLWCVQWLPYIDTTFFSFSCGFTCNSSGAFIHLREILLKNRYILPILKYKLLLEIENLFFFNLTESYRIAQFLSARKSLFLPLSYLRRAQESELGLVTESQMLHLGQTQHKKARFRRNAAPSIEETFSKTHGYEALMKGGLRWNCRARFLSLVTIHI